ncbi:MAG: protein kinase, partial [Pirellulales bacterium]|nr:protein kinase [Pirellulales bacterium]
VARHGPLAVADACEIVRQAARGLQYIHKNGMVHRDIKPSNLMVTLVDPDQISGESTLAEPREGQRAVVKILDLGLALLAEDNQQRLTRFENKAMGTGMYMSPEQWKTTSVDIRADVYSLGCTLYHLLAGRPPFYDSDLRPEKANEKSAVPPIRNHPQPLPRKLWEVLQKMLAKRPEDRFAVPADVAAALAPLAEGHALPGLIQAYSAAGGAGAAMTPTQPAGISGADTWRSKPRRAREVLARNRQWLINRGVPVLLIIGFLCGAAWLLRSGVQQERERNARATLPAIAHTAASGELAAEIDGRFATLTRLAADDKLIAALRADDREALDDWIASLTHDTGVTVDSWFVTNAAGEQVARSPKGDSVGETFKSRDYFHGLGRELTDSAEIESARPIRSPHLSTVYQSFTTQKFKVAFSVPIFDKPPEPPAAPAAAPAREPPGQPSATVIGVLAMSVNLADFEVLDSSQSGGNEVVLIDLRPDELDGKPQAGLILHHPRQNKGQVKRIGSQLLADILGADPFGRRFSSEQSFLSGYVDPFTPDVLYWGAFQPIRMRALESQGGGAESQQRGWIVLVQRPEYQ